MDQDLHITLQKPLSAKEVDVVFKLRDTNRDDVIDKKELMNDSRASKICLTHDEIRDDVIDKKEPMKDSRAPKICITRNEIRDDVIDKKEPTKDSRASKICLTRDEIRDIFLEHDIDGDGYLTCSEVTKAFACMGAMNPMMKANYGLKLADADGDNLISEDELEKLIDYFEKTNKKSLKRKS